MLGHVARMDEDRIPKRMLFGCLPLVLRKEAGTCKVAQGREVGGKDVVLCWKMPQRREHKRIN